jgi:hypothetical protein
MSKTPPPCNPKVFKEGQSIMACDTSDCRSQGFEAWIVSIRETLPKGCEIDWHYSGGIANVLCLGDREVILRAVHEKMDECPARVMRWVGEDEFGPYRKDVSPAPEGAIAGSYDPGSGATEFFIERET